MAEVDTEAGVSGHADREEERVVEVVVSRSRYTPKWMAIRPNQNGGMARPTNDRPVKT